MRRVSGLVAILALGAMWMPAAVADGGTGMEFECYDAVASPGETVRAAVTLTNESDLPYRYKVKARTRGDNELVRGRHRGVRGKWTKMKFTLEPGETRVEEMMLRVPGRAEGPMVAEIRVKGPDGRHRERDSLFVHDDGAGPTGEEPMEVQGRIMRDDDGAHPLVMQTAGGDEYRMVGSEADELYDRMVENGMDEAEGYFMGYGMDEMPMRMMSHMMLDDEEKFLMLECDVEGLMDGEYHIVPNMPVMAGEASSIGSMMTMVIRSEEDWEDLMDMAGIDMPMNGSGSGIPMGSDDDDMHSGGFMGSDGGMGSASSMSGSSMGSGGMMKMLAVGPDAMGVGHEDDDDGHHPGFFHHGTDEVDFEEHTLICVFAGAQDAEGYAVRIRGITEEEDGSLLCHYSLEEPGRRQRMMGGMSQPYTVVAIPKTDAEIRFTTD